MILSVSNLRNCLSSVRSIRAKVELYEGSTLVDTYNYTDRLLSFTVDRIGEDSKFFGFDVCQKAKIKLQDKNKELNITTANHFKIYLAADGQKTVGAGEYVNPFPDMYVSEVHRDERTNALSITTYDLFHEMAEHTTSELALAAPYTIQDYANACAAMFGLTVSYKYFDVSTSAFMTSYPTGANLEGTETIRDVLTAIAEATQTICYISGTELVFKRLTSDYMINDAFSIEKSMYMELETGDNRRLGTVCHATELGDNVSASLSITGSTQYVRDNPFWDMRDDIDTIVENALAAVGGLTIQELEVKWRGLFLVEIGDLFNCMLKDNESISNTCFLLNDTLEYDGSLTQKTSWKYADDAETESNPSSLGEVLKQTYAKVDKANKNIELTTKQVETNSNAIASLQLNTDSISSSVSKLEKETNDALENMDETISELDTKIEQTAEDVNITITDIKINGVNKVTTDTGFTFNEEGLTVSKSDSDITTTITEDGMIVRKGSTDVLTADNTGVKALNLHATTYLFIGVNSRFQDYNNNTRTGCFWVGK